MLAELKKGQRLIVGFKAGVDSKTIGVPVSLKGLTEAVKAINIK
jgi:invasion protein IalB